MTRSCELEIQDGNEINHEEREVERGDFVEIDGTYYRVQQFDYGIAKLFKLGGDGNRSGNQVDMDEVETLGEFLDVRDVSYNNVRLIKGDKVTLKLEVEE